MMMMFWWWCWWFWWWWCFDGGDDDDNDDDDDDDDDDDNDDDNGDDDDDDYDDGDYCPSDIAIARLCATDLMVKTRPYVFLPPFNKSKKLTTSSLKQPMQAKIICFYIIWKLFC